ncbi:hypothetical protein L0657_12545 [Dyadobacter sp. CY345]|uniref:hypothetical protein n=1 Tax=Dyadobacter sp. CY345 TaxID=2909335 RepID=UPI001F334B9F|nr:hypothetical protein [Dyadobacter sp. CY345]MCF2444789.1 hypothetical protein [Dyadobacter sp. CY345]
MEITYYLNETEEENLFCNISEDGKTVSFPLGYTVEDGEWDEENAEVSPDDPYFYSLMSFKNYLAERYETLSFAGETDVLDVLKSEVEAITAENGIQSIARNMFDNENTPEGIPSYNAFIQAFEKFSGLEDGEFEALVIDNTLEFGTEDGDDFQMDTVAGLKTRLRSFIEKKSFAEMGAMTSKFIWSKIYNDAGGIEKHIFLPEMLLEWEIFWDNEYEEMKNAGGDTKNLAKAKEKSWRQFQVFMACYNDSVDIIQLAFEIDDMELYPLIVTVMLRIFDAEVCYDEYCEAEFSGDDWQMIESDGEKFFLKEGDF